MIYLYTLLLTLLITVLLVPITVRIAEHIEKYDMPGRRKMHVVPIPRTGGIAMAISVFSSMLLWAPQSSFLSAYVMGAGIIVVFGLIDDFVDMPYLYKFVGQILAALVIIFMGGVEIRQLGTLLPGHGAITVWVAVPLTVIVIVAVTNAINLADGLDGLAGGVSILSFCCIGYLAYLSDHPVIALLAIALVGSIFGFLKYNTHPASVFMGDTGSQFLGFSLVTLALSLTQNDTHLSPLLPMIIFGFPILDTVVVMLERIGSGRSPFKADQNHFHHKLIRLGFFHTEAVFIIYVLQAVLVVSAFVFRESSDRALVIAYGIFSNLVIIGFFAAQIAGWKVPRYTLIDGEIKGRLAKIRDKGVWIVLSFRITEYGIPALLFATTFIPGSIPLYLSYIAAGLLGLTLVVALVRRRWLRWCLMADIYVMVPIVVFFGIDAAHFTTAGPVMLVYNVSFVVMTFFVMATLRLTRRREGFRVTPMDFLIVFIVIIAPVISGMYGEYRQLTFVAAKTVMLYFSYEVLIGELRGQYRKLTVLTACSLVVIIGRGFLRF